MKADPNLVPYRQEWTDNLGGMANAIFWLEKHWKSDLNAQGDRVMSDGTRWFWNYSPSTDLLLVHIAGTHKNYEIDREKMVVVGVEGRAMGQIYRPFFSARAYGMPTYEHGLPVVEWLLTREVKIVKNHHPDRFPLYLGGATKTLYKLLLDSPLAQFPQVRLHNLLVGTTAAEHKTLMSHECVVAYSNLLNQMRTVKRTTVLFQDFHVHSYWELLNALRAFNRIVDPVQDTDAYYAAEQETEIQRLLDEGHETSAAIVLAMKDKIQYGKALELIERRVK